MHSQYMINLLNVTGCQMRDLLEEFKRPEEDQVMVYTTPLENLRLVVEYVSDIRAWQAYLGEFSNEEKTGKGVIVSCRDQGNAGGKCIYRDVGQ